MRRSPSRQRPRTALLAALAAVAIGLAACGGDPSTSAATEPPSEASTSTLADSAPATAADTTVADTTSDTTPDSTPDTAAEAPAPTIPAGTVLRVGDQGGGLETPLRLAGELDDVPYDVALTHAADRDKVRRTKDVLGLAIQLETILTTRPRFLTSIASKPPLRI